MKIVLIIFHFLILDQFFSSSLAINCVDCVAAALRRCPLSAWLLLNFELLVAAAIFKLVFWFSTKAAPAPAFAAKHSLMRSVPFRRSVNRVPVWTLYERVGRKGVRGFQWCGGWSRERFWHAVCWFLREGSCWFLGPMRYNFMLLLYCGCCCCRCCCRGLNLKRVYTC